MITLCTRLCPFFHIFHLSLELDVGALLENRWMLTYSGVHYQRHSITLEAVLRRRPSISLVAIKGIGLTRRCLLFMAIRTFLI